MIFVFRHHPLLGLCLRSALFFADFALCGYGFAYIFKGEAAVLFGITIGEKRLLRPKNDKIRGGFATYYLHNFGEKEKNE